jgi:hypothetical protein
MKNIRLVALKSGNNKYKDDKAETKMMVKLAKEKPFYLHRGGL